MSLQWDLEVFDWKQALRCLIRIYFDSHFGVLISLSLLFRFLLYRVRTTHSKKQGNSIKVPFLTLYFGTSMT